VKAEASCDSLDTSISSF